MGLHSRATALTGIAAIAAAPAVLRAADPPALRIGAQLSDSTAQHLYAQDLGMFKAAGLNVELSPIRNSGALVAAIAGGSLDIMTSSIVSIAQAHIKGIDLRTFALGAVYDGPPPQSVIAVAPNSPIRSGADLNGKIVAVNGLGDFTQVLLSAWIDATGGDVKSVKMAEIPFSSVAVSLAQGRVDAALLIEPFTTAAGTTVKVIGDPQLALGKRYMITGWFALENWLNANRDTARRFAGVMVQTAKWGNRNHEQSAVILAKYLSLSPDVIKAAPRAVYGEQAVTPPMLQPVLDYSTRYIGLEKLSAASLIWRS
jgi:NitT/TauT family transport system substrate-binding protein